MSSGLQARPPGAIVNDEESASRGGGTRPYASADDIRKMRENSHEDPDDWAERWWFQTGLHLTMCVAFGTIILAAAALILLSPAQVAHDYLTDPAANWVFNTYMGFTGWFAVIVVNGSLAFLLGIMAWCRGCANCTATEYNMTHQDKLAMPYKPLSVTGWWCLWNLAFWAGDIGWMSLFWWKGTDLNIVEQMGWYLNIWWFTVIACMFTCLPGIVHRSRHVADTWHFCCKSGCPHF